MANILIEDYIRAHNAKKESPKKEIALTVANLGKPPKAILTKVSKRI